MGRKNDLDLAVADLAAKQHGVVARRQLLALGVGSEAIQSRRTSRRYVPLHRGVYAVGHAELTPDGFGMAAVLAAGPGAFLHRWSAAGLWALRPFGGRHHVGVPTGGGRRRRRYLRAPIVHRVLGVRPEDLTTHRGIPTTTVARTLLDLAGALPAHELRRAVEAAERAELFDLGAVDEVLAAHHGQLGTVALRALLDDARTHGLPVTRSELEALMLQLCLDHGLPRPVVNVADDGPEVDFRWPAWRLMVETDGWSTHGSRDAFERDRLRDRRLAVEGWRVVRITWRQLVDDPAAVAADLRALLAAPGSARERPSAPRARPVQERVQLARGLARQA